MSMGTATPEPTWTYSGRDCGDCGTPIWVRGDETSGCGCAERASFAEKAARATRGWRPVWQVRGLLVDTMRTARDVLASATTPEYQALVTRMREHQSFFRRWPESEWAPEVRGAVMAARRMLDVWTLPLAELDELPARIAFIEALSPSQVTGDPETYVARLRRPLEWLPNLAEPVRRLDALRADVEAIGKRTPLHVPPPPPKKPSGPQSWNTAPPPRPQVRAESLAARMDE